MKLFNVEKAARVYVYREPTNMGKSFRGLAEIIENNLHAKPDSGDMFLFANKKLSYLKILWYFKGGPCIFAKRLDIGAFEIGNTRVLSLEAMQHIVDHVTMDKDTTHLRRVAA